MRAKNALFICRFSVFELYRRRDHNQKLIKSTSPDSEGSRIRGSEEATQPQIIIKTPSRHTRVLVAELLPVILLVVIPFSVHAGVFSSIIGLVQATSTDTLGAATIRATDVRLLSASNTSDPKAALGGGDVIVEEGALKSGGLFGEDYLAQTQSQSGEISVYVVREGDTLSQIAQMFNVTSNTILWANDIKSANTIQPGDTLVILPIVGVRHVVKKGDTISTISKKYDGNVEEIISYNQLASIDDLSVGDTIVVPGGNMHKAAPKPATRGGVSPTKVTGTASAANFSHPVPGAVKSQGIHGYNAVDLAASAGTTVYAAAAGEVIISKSSGWNGGYGNYIVIKHANGSQTLYAHLSYNSVGVGEYVANGTVIGSVGNTGRSTGAHLHFEVRGARNPF